MKKSNVKDFATKMLNGTFYICSGCDYFAEVSLEDIHYLNFSDSLKVLVKCPICGKIEISNAFSNKLEDIFNIIKDGRDMKPDHLLRIFGMPELLSKVNPSLPSPDQLIEKAPGGILLCNLNSVPYVFIKLIEENRIIYKYKMLTWGRYQTEYTEVSTLNLDLIFDSKKTDLDLDITIPKSYILSNGILNFSDLVIDLKESTIEEVRDNFFRLYYEENVYTLTYDEHFVYVGVGHTREVQYLYPITPSENLVKDIRECVYFHKGPKIK